MAPHGYPQIAGKTFLFRIPSDWNAYRHTQTNKGSPKR
jgi:hypothetical protein